jgi:hypothetical protein
MVGRERGLQPIGGQLSAHRDHASVVDQDIEPVVPGQDLLGKPAHLRQARQVRGHGLDLRERYAPADLVAGRLTACRVPGGNDHGSAERGQPQRRLLADPAGRAGHQAGLARHRRHATSRQDIQDQDTKSARSKASMNRAVRCDDAAGMVTGRDGILEAKLAGLPLDHWYGLLVEPLGVCAERE